MDKIMIDIREEHEKIIEEFKDKDLIHIDDLIDKIIELKDEIEYLKDEIDRLSKPKEPDYDSYYEDFKLGI